MATTQVNNGQPIRFEAGGIFSINDGTNDYEFNNREKGSLRIKFAGYEPLEWQEKGVNKIPLEGDEQVAEVELELKLSNPEASNSLPALVRKRNTLSSQGLTFVYPTAKIDIPDYRGGTTGMRIALTNAWFVPDSFEIQAGVQFDTVRFRMRCTAIADPVNY